MAGYSRHGSQWVKQQLLDKFVIKTPEQKSVRSVNTVITCNNLHVLCTWFKCVFFSLSTSRDDFIRIPELAINPIGERIIDAFFMNEDSQ